MMRRLWWSAGVTCLVVLGGCANSIAERMVAAPNGEYHALYPHYTSIPAGVASAIDQDSQAVHLRRMPVESGAVSLRMVVLEPADAPFARIAQGEWRRAWKPTLREPVGTVILLHGLWGSIDYLTDHGVAFANAGWRTVILELRGHGESTGNTVTYGNTESRDVIEVLERLRADGTLHGPVALVGWSLGGAVAIMAAGRGAPVDAVVAVAPFAHLRDVAPNFAAQFGGWFSWLATDGLADRVIARAGVIGGFDPIADSPLALVPHVHQPLLLVHSSADDLIPVTQSKRLADAAGGPVTYILVPGMEHGEEVLNAALSVPAILDWLRRTPPGRAASDDPLMLIGPLANHPGKEASGISTWTWRPLPWDLTGTWPRPAGVRWLRVWPAIPLPWLYRDLDLDLGTMECGDETRYAGVVIGATPFSQPWPAARSRRYRIPGWLQRPDGEVTIRLESDQKDTGVSWAGGAPIMRPAPQQ